MENFIFVCLGLNNLFLLKYFQYHYYSSNINEVIRAVLNFLFFLRKDFARTKKTKSTKRSKSTKSAKTQICE